MAEEKEVKKLMMKDVIKKINKTCKEWDILASGSFSQNLQKISLGSLAFDFPFKGGYPRGQLITASGVEHSGKSTFAALSVAAYQAEEPDKVCVYVDAENTLLVQSEYFKTVARSLNYNLSYEPEHFVRYDTTGRSAEEIFQDLITMQGTEDIGLIVIDSARALISQIDLDSPFTKDNGQRASIAKSMGKFIKQMMMYLPKRNNSLLILNQVDVEKGMFSTTYTEPCGYALKYFPSLKLRFGTRTYTKGDKVNLTQSDVKKAEDADGVQLHFAIVKSRLGQITKAGGYITIRYDTGVDTIFDLLQVAIPAGFIQKVGKKFALTDLETGELYTSDFDENGIKHDLLFDNEEQLNVYFRTHLDFTKDYIKMINAHVSKHKLSLDLVDAAIMDDLFKQEADTTGGNEMTAAEALAADGVGEND